MARLKSDTPPSTAPARRVPPIRGLVEEPEEDEAIAADVRPFLLLWQRGDYVVLPDGEDGFAVAPRLIVQPLEHGSGGILQRRDGIYDLSGFEQDAKVAKKMLLSPTLGYCTEIRPGSNQWCPVWAEVQGTEVVQEQSAYLAWALERIEDGTIPAPGRRDLKGLRSRLVDLIALTRNERGHEERVGPLTEQLQCVDAALAALAAPAAA
jgi:hypothetical protein